ncbi:Ig-like domain-containing protein [Streptomyces sp. NPDC005078]|uniref:L,D-transpeptidase n=1 Tax=unclassified Streptomyces TaxID=2593676 RepID=UPI0033ABF070
MTARKARTRLTVAVGVLGGVVSLAALGGTSNAATSGNDVGSHPKPQARARAEQAATPEVSDARIKITPKQGSYDVGIDDSVKVTVSNGKLTKVTMTAVASGAEVPGTLSADGTSWKPNGRLDRATRYQVAAEAKDAKGRSVSGNATVTTLSPANNFIGHISPEDGSTVGVGMPVTVNFDKAVGDKSAMESKIQVSSSSGQQVVGHWFNDDRLDFRPKNHWKAGSTVTVTLNPHGTQKTVTFKIGRSQISTVDAKTKQMTVVRDGKTIKTIPISSGSTEHPTYNGQMVISEKFRQIHMNGATVGLTKKDGSPSYDIEAVPHAMRLTASGTFIHGNYWGADAVFGKANTSHGCVGLKDVKGGGDGKQPAAWFFDNSMIGDVVIVKNSDDKTTLAPDNGFSDWNMPWSEWVAGSATG